MTWMNAPLKPADDDVGFVYTIWDRQRHLYYIGQKRFWKVDKKKPTKYIRKDGKFLKDKDGKRIINTRTTRKHIKKESDWRTYNSSNKEIQALFVHEPDRFIKRIERVCKGKMDMNCWETYMQLQYYVNGNWNKLYNEVINLRGSIPKDKNK